MNSPPRAPIDAGRFAEAELRAGAQAGRGREPLTCGVPWPRGALPQEASLRLQDDQGQPLPLQARVLDRWPDGSARWVLLDWQADVGASAVYRARVAPQREPPVPPAAVRVEQHGERVAVDTGLARFELGAGPTFPFRSVVVRGERAVDEAATALGVEDEQGRVYRPHIESLEVEEAGPLRAAVRLRGALTRAGAAPLADLDVWLHFFAGSAVVRFELTLRNPRKAEHPGGLWDLGNGGSIYLRDASFTVTAPPSAGPAHIRCSPETGAPFEDVEAPLEVYQDSSGGENWSSSNHLNRRRVVPNTFRGYRLRAGGAQHSGLRATPAVYLSRGGHTLGVAMPWFWQTFPKAVEASAEGVLVLRLFPRQYADVHELQGGEQKTHTFSVLFGVGDSDNGPPGAHTGPQRELEAALAWCREPARVGATPTWYCSTGALPYLTPRAEDPNPLYLQLVDAAIEGPDTFDHKREVIDEYGWRHFGDIYGDHEAVFHKGPTPLVSHYNNQYDPVAGFAYQFFRSGDFRWLRHLEELATHVIDIDLYHTDRDKPAYNHGQFWHTYHYVDADTGTHRSYPRAARVCGGGPANEQSYTTGLMLHHFLTGSTAAREAVLELGRWVIDLDDGSKTVFRWLARGYTGLASQSRTRTYHGPGRGAANAIAVLLDAHRLSGDPAFLTKAEQLIRRCIHPQDDVAARNLLDAENRWFYTMFLQSLGRYLDYKAQRNELDFRYAYARASLLHYARWMAEQEYPYLEKPEILEYPTETWAAQDMRKSEVFKYAAKHATGVERARFLERSEFFFRYSTTTLAGMKTRTLVRPVVLLLSYGFMHAYFQMHPEEAAPPPAQDVHDFGRPEVFIPQKARALKRFKVLVLAGAVAGLLGAGWLVSLLLG
jgi:hypothetical protein